MRHQIVVHLLSGNTIEGAIKPGDPEYATQRVDAALECSTNLTVEQDGNCFVTVPVKHIECVVVGDPDAEEPR